MWPLSTKEYKNIKEKTGKYPWLDLTKIGQKNKSHPSYQPKDVKRHDQTRLEFWKKKKSDEWGKDRRYTDIHIERYPLKNELNIHLDHKFEQTPGKPFKRSKAKLPSLQEAKLPSSQEGKLI